VVRPKQHLTRFFGVFAPHSKARAEVTALVPKVSSSLGPACVQKSSPASNAYSGEFAPKKETPFSERNDNVATTQVAFLHRPRLDWPNLIARTFETDVWKCPLCGGQRKVLAVVTERAAIRKFLRLDDSEPSRVTLAPPTGPPQFSFGLGL